MVDVTVIIPFYNNPNNLKRALISLSNQTKLPKRVIIIDDCSEYWENINKSDFYTGNLAVDFLKNEHNSGPSVARNFGISNANTEFIAFLDEDDEWHHKKLEIQHGIMKDFNMCITSTAHSLGRISSEKINFDNPSIQELTFNSILYRNRINTSSVMLRRVIFNSFRFEESLRYTQDYDLWLRILKVEPIFLINLPLTIRHLDPLLKNLSFNLKKMYYDEIKTVDRNIDSFSKKTIIKSYITLKLIRRFILKRIYISSLTEQ